MIIETCPRCGHDLIKIMLTSNPPIHKKECWSCGWSWIGEPEKIERVPFGGNSFNEDKPSYLGKRSYLSLVDDSIIDEITEEAIQECLFNAINTTITNQANKYMD